MNKLLVKVVIVPALMLISPNSFAWTFLGDVIIGSNKVEAITIASSAPNEVYGLTVLATLSGNSYDTDSDYCIATQPNWTVICAATAEELSPTNGTNYCGAGVGASLVLGVPNPNDTKEWGSVCKEYGTPTVWCYDPPQFLGCPYGCMSSPYLMQWGGQNASSFVVQKSGFTGWSNWYSGTNTSSYASTGTNYHEYFKVKAVNASGSSDWCHMTLYVQCSEEMDPW